MNINLPYPIRVIRASIKDFLDHAPKSSWFFTVTDESGITDFVFHMDIGIIGSIRLLEMPDDQTQFSAEPSPAIPKSEILRLIAGGKVYINEADRKTLTPVIDVFRQQEKLGIDKWGFEDYLRHHEDNPQIDLPANTREEREAARPVLEKYTEKFSLKKGESYQNIIGATVVHLRMLGMWPAGKEEAPTAANQFVVILNGQSMRLDMSRLDKKEGQPGRPFEREYVDAFKQIIMLIENENMSWKDAKRTAMVSYFHSKHRNPDNYDKQRFNAAIRRCLTKARIG